jgi:hypothetical protein
VSDEEILLYDLSNRPASFDFVTCLATATALGIKHVRFVLNAGWKPKNYSRQQAVERFISIVEPAVALYGLDYSVGDRRGVEINHLLKAATETYKNTGRIGKIQTTCEAGDYITVTLRKSRNPERNSNESEWQKFADSCGERVVIIPDSEGGTFPLAERMKTYASAKMNFMVMNGPATLCFHSDAPYLVMRTIGCENSGSISPSSSKVNGIYPGFQFPWANRNQKLSYLTDTAENIVNEWMGMQERKAA